MTRVLRLSILLASLAPLSGCLFRSHTVERRMSTAPLMRATRDELVAGLNANATLIQTLDATVDISPSVGGSKKGKVTDYTQIRGYILLRKPAMLRMIGLFPVLRNRAFDMVSDGQTFRLSIPPRNKFVIGRNDLIYPSQEGLSGLRPQHILDALLMRPVNAQNEIAILQSENEIVIDPKSKKEAIEPNYGLEILRNDPAPVGWVLSRKIYFNREDLRISRELLYDTAGNVITDTHYSGYVKYGIVDFPSLITIDRPQEEYSIVLSIVKMIFNQPLRDDQFVLVQPPGSQLVRLDVEPPPKLPAAAEPKPSKSATNSSPPAHEE